MPLVTSSGFRESARRRECRGCQAAFFDFLSEEDRKLASFVSTEVKAAFGQIARIVSCYEEEEQNQKDGKGSGKAAMLVEQAELPESMAKLLDYCAGYKPVVRNFIFREVLAACAKKDDLRTFRLITERYGNRFGIVRYIPGVNQDAFVDEGWLSREDRDFYVTQKPEFLDLLGIEENGEAEEAYYHNRCFLPLHLPDERDPNVRMEPSIKVVSGEYRTGRAALLCGNSTMLFYLKKRGVSFKHGITRIERSGSVVEVNLLEAALLSVSGPAVGMALEECTQEEKYRDEENSIIKLLPEESLEVLFTCNPEAAEHMEDSLAVTCASKAVLTAWLQAGTRSRQQKMAVLRTVLEECTSMKGVTKFRNDQKNYLQKMNQHRLCDDVNRTESAITAFLRELYRSCGDSNDRNHICRLAYLYWLKHPVQKKKKDLQHFTAPGAGWEIPDEDMREYFSNVRDIAWFFCLHIRDGLRYSLEEEKAEHFGRIREWMQWEEEKPLPIGDEILEFPLWVLHDAAEIYLCNKKNLQDFQFVSKHKEYLEAFSDTIIEYEAWDCVIPAFKQGFLTIENLSSMLVGKRCVPEQLKEEIMKRMHSVSIEKEIGIK